MNAIVCRTCRLMIAAGDCTLPADCSSRHGTPELVDVTEPMVDVGTPENPRLVRDMTDLLERVKAETLSKVR